MTVRHDCNPEAAGSLLDDKDGWLHLMSSIRIAIATALAAAAVFAGGVAQTHHAAPTTSHTAALAAAPNSASPVLCC